VTGSVLAVDQGTSATKALVVSSERGVLGSCEVPVRPRYGEGGAVEQDPEQLLASVVDAGRGALAAAGEPVVAVGLANQGETVLAWDPGSGRPLSDALVWQDRRARSVTERLAVAGERLTALTGLPLDPYFAAPKMAWLREQVTTDGVVTTSDVWLMNRLTGAFVTDASTASRTLLLDLDRCEWSQEALKVFDLARERLPEVVDAAGAYSETNAFSEPLPVTGLLVDQQAALLAQSCLGAGEAKCTFGTGAFLLANVGDRAPRSGTGLVTSVAWRVRGATTYCLDGQVFTAASAVRWLVDLGVLPSAAALDEVAGTADSTGGVTFVPALAGLGAPWWRPEARGSLRGLGLGTTAGHLARALVEGIAAQVADLAEAVADDLGRPLDRLRVDGGLTRSRLLLQAQADLLQVPVEVYASPDATALGVAAAARLGLDPVLAIADAVQAWRPSAVVEPQASVAEAADRMATFRAAVAAVLAEHG